MKNWTLSQLQQELSSHPSIIKGWILHQEIIERRERYFMAPHQETLLIDQDRRIEQTDFRLQLMVHIGQAGKQGETSKKLFPSQPLAPQIQEAIAAAIQTQYEAWELPTQLPTEVIPELQTADSLILEDLEKVIHQGTQRIQQSIQATQKKYPALFHSAELFIALHHRELFLSNGLHYRSRQSRLFTEAAFSHLQGETLNSHWAVSLDQLPIEEIFESTAEQSLHAIDTHAPKTGSYFVLLPAKVLSQLFWDAISQLSSAQSYHQLPFLPPGSELIPGATGDLITLTLDPTLPLGGDTTALSSQGILQTPLRLVEKNKVIASQTDQQFASYLKQAPSTTRGNLVVEPGHSSYEELIHQEDAVLEILEFSGLFTDPHTRTFSSEIRLARIHHPKGPVEWIRGGSLSGSLSENFKNLKLAQATTWHTHFASDSAAGETYFGPQYALLSHVSIVGPHSL